MVKLRNYKVKGSILEPIIALMIVSFALTASFTVVIQSNQQRSFTQNIRAQQVAAFELHETLKQKNYLSESRELEGLKLEKSVESYEGYENLIKVQITVRDVNNNILTKRYRIVTHVE